MSELGFLGLKDDRITNNDATEHCAFHNEGIMRKYPKYKASGIEWIDDVPIGWKIAKLKFIANNLNRRRVPLEEQVRRDMTNKEFDYYGATGIIDKVEKFLFDETTILIAEDGANLISRNIQLIYIATGKYWVNNHAHILKPKANCLLDFLALRLECFDYSNLIRGAAQPKLTKEDLMNICLPIPPFPEQLSIIRFLDHKTGQMDRFIANRQKQIELLKEQKAAIINKAVTGKIPMSELGLKDDRIKDTNASKNQILPSSNPKNQNSDRKMKPSGIEWIGEIPENWIVIRLKYIIKTMASGVSVNSTDEPAEANEYGVLKTSCVYTGEFNPNENKKIVENEYHRMACPVKANTIIISRMNTPELVGANGFVDKDYVGLFLPDRLWQTIFFKKAKIVPRWLSYFLSSNRFRTLLSSLATGTSASMKNITQEDVLGSFICLPPIDEQNAMVSFFEEETSVIDTLISKYQKQIDLMQEYRTSLISQAVTGKIDVRENVEEKCLN